MAMLVYERVPLFQVKGHFAETSSRTGENAWESQGVLKILKKGCFWTKLRPCQQPDHVVASHQHVCLFFDWWRWSSISFVRDERNAEMSLNTIVF